MTKRDIRAEIAAYVEREVAKAPPLKPGQVAIVSRALRGEPLINNTPKPPNAYQLEQQRKAEEHAQAIKDAEALAASLIACDACNLPPVAHRVQRQYGGVGFHEWVPGRAQRILESQPVSI